MTLKHKFSYLLLFFLLIGAINMNAQQLDVKKELKELQDFEKKVDLMNQAFNNKDQAYLNRIHGELLAFIEQEIKQQTPITALAKKKVPTSSPVMILDQMTEQEYLDINLPNPSKEELKVIRLFEQKNIRRILQRNSFSLDRDNAYKLSIARKSIYRFMESMGNDIRDIDPKMLPVETRL